MPLTPAAIVVEKLRQVRLAECALAQAVLELKIAQRDYYREEFHRSLNPGEVPTGTLEELRRAAGLPTCARCHGDGFPECRCKAE